MASLVEEVGSGPSGKSNGIVKLVGLEGVRKVNVRYDLVVGNGWVTLQKSFLCQFISHFSC